MKKFDFIIGNPPFQNSNTVNKVDNLWDDMCVKFMDKVEQDGTIFFVTPDSCLSPTSATGKKFKDTRNSSLEYIMAENVKETYFPKVGSTFAVWKWQKKPYSGTTLYNGEEIDISKYQFLIPNVEKMKLVNKIIAFGEFFPIKYDSVTAHSTLLTKNPTTLSKIQDEKFQFPIHH